MAALSGLTSCAGQHSTGVEVQERVDQTRRVAVETVADGAIRQPRVDGPDA